MLSFLNEVELMVCNGKELVFEPQWTKVGPKLKQKSIIDYTMYRYIHLHLTIGKGVSGSALTIACSSYTNFAASKTGDYVLAYTIIII